ASMRLAGDSDKRHTCSFGATRVIHGVANVPELLRRPHRLCSLQAFGMRFASRDAVRSQDRIERNLRSEAADRDVRFKERTSGVDAEVEVCDEIFEGTGLGNPAFAMDEPV